MGLDIHKRPIKLSGQPIENQLVKFILVRVLGILRFRRREGARVLIWQGDFEFRPLSQTKNHRSNGDGSGRWSYSEPDAAARVLSQSPSPCPWFCSLVPR